MRLEKLREVLLVKAIEEADVSGEVIPLNERDDASSRARTKRGPFANANNKKISQALSERASSLLKPVLAKHPVLGNLLAFSGWQAWAAAAALAVALASGFSLSLVNEAGRINVLALPIWGLIAWNLLVYLWVALAFVRKKRGQGSTMTRWMGMAMHRAERRLRSTLVEIDSLDSVLGNAANSFVASWNETASGVRGRQLRTILHLAAAVMAVGLILGLYARGFGHQHAVCWESTLLDATDVNRLMNMLFGKIGPLFGIDLPQSVADYERLNCANGGQIGDQAGHWFRLIALVLTGTVILPRIALSGYSYFVSQWLQRSSQLPNQLNGYAQRVLGLVPPQTQFNVCLFPYEFAPSPEFLDRLQGQINLLLGGNVQFNMQPVIQPGNAGAIRGHILPGAKAADRCVVIMNLHSKPKGNLHGAAIDAIHGCVLCPANRFPLRLVIDESEVPGFKWPFPPIFKQRRLNNLRRDWREFAAGFAYGLNVIFVTPPPPTPADGAQPPQENVPTPESETGKSWKTWCGYKFWEWLGRRPGR